jgi:DNA-binding beta-propeller fold protein YncE
VACGALATLALALVCGSAGALARGSAHGPLEQPAGTAGCATETGNGGSCADLKGLSFPTAVAVGPGTSRDVYVASYTPISPYRSSVAHLVATVSRDPNAPARPLEQLLANGQGCVADTSVGTSCAVGRGLRLPSSVAVSPDGRNVYVASAMSDAVAVFARRPSDGELNQLQGRHGCVSETGTEGCADGRALDRAASVAVSPDGKHVYVATRGGGAVAVFRRELRDPQTLWGRLVQLPGTAGCVSETGSGGACVDGRGLAGATSIAVSRDGKNVYVASGTASGSSSSDAVAVFVRNARTGALTQLPKQNGCISDTGSSGECTDGRQLLGASSVAVSPDGRNVYVTAEGNSSVAVFARDTVTGRLVQIPGQAGCVGGASSCTDVEALQRPLAVAVSPDGGAVYVSSRAHSGAVVVLARDKIGRLTQLPGSDGCVAQVPQVGSFVCAQAKGLLASVPLAGDRAAQGMAIRADGRYLYVAAPRALAVFGRHR